MAAAAALPAPSSVVAGAAVAVVTQGATVLTGNSYKAVGRAGVIILSVVTAVALAALALTVVSLATPFVLASASVLWITSGALLFIAAGAVLGAIAIVRVLPAREADEAVAQATAEGTRQVQALDGSLDELRQVQADLQKEQAELEASLTLLDQDNALLTTTAGAISTAVGTYAEKVRALGEELGRAEGAAANIERLNAAKRELMTTLGTTLERLMDKKTEAETLTRGLAAEVTRIRERTASKRADMERLQAVHRDISAQRERVEGFMRDLHTLEGTLGRSVTALEARARASCETAAAEQERLKAATEAFAELKSGEYPRILGDVAKSLGKLEKRVVERHDALLKLEPGIKALRDRLDAGSALSRKATRA